MLGDKKKTHKIFSEWFYSLNYLPTLNVSVFRPSSGCVIY